MTNIFVNFRSLENCSIYMRHKMKMTINGLVPVDFVGEANKTEVLKENPIGKVEEKDGI